MDLHRRKAVLSLCGLGMGLVLALVLLSFLGLERPDLGAGSDWSTSNEGECCPGEWDTVVYYTVAAGSYVTRTSERAHTGSFSYEHFADCPDSTCWAFTAITCSVPMTQGELTAYVAMSSTLPGIGVLRYPIIAAGDLWQLSPPGFDEAWEIYYDSPSDQFRVACYVCDPDRTWPLAGVAPLYFHEFRVEWNLPPDSSSGQLSVWQDGILYVSESGLTTEPGGSYPEINGAGVGIKDWHFWWGDRIPLWVDDVTVYGCDPLPTPTPAPAECDRYGHAAVINIGPDCKGVLRFGKIRLPRDARVTAATLRLYGVSVQGSEETIYITPLKNLWGEMTCSWCNRLMWTAWYGAGASHVPLDREPGAVTSFQTRPGWIEVSLPPSLIEEWSLTKSANPGLVLYGSEDMTGKISIASREWYTAEYRPELRVYYTLD